ncbi:hypothetical protein BT96DRAFT_929628 [Gymnopus androsaceus JB14]|uniref:Uncharacterized protein n=1 Tax=Gymnopus androsaceus JB14 TaxID=1447944 RepID=A0A6A4GE59_9AGAR|nr:hypothetical protein BT96DRAFT_929628 [Gymnopus androsaceus JB14]
METFSMMNIGKSLPQKYDGYTCESHFNFIVLTPKYWLFLTELLTGYGDLLLAEFKY